MEYFCNGLQTYHSILLKIENREYYFTMRFTGILFSFLMLLFGSYDVSRGNELQRMLAS